MLEDIRKEIANQYAKGYVAEHTKITIEKILDKYNNQESNHQKTRDSQHKRILDLEKYEKCWEELKNDNTELIEYGNRAVKDAQLYKNKKMYLLEQQYNLGSDKDVKN